MGNIGWMMDAILRGVWLSGVRNCRSAFSKEGRTLVLKLGNFEGLRLGGELDGVGWEGAGLGGGGCVNDNCTIVNEGCRFEGCLVRDYH